MPIYEYKCEICHQFFEKTIHSAGVENSSDVTCPKCGDTRVKQVKSPTGFAGTICANVGGRFS